MRISKRIVWPLIIAVMMVGAFPVLWEGPVAQGQAAPQAGGWVGTVSYGSQADPREGQLWFNVGSNSFVTEGQVILRFTTQSMSDAMRAAMNDYGCRVDFRYFDPNGIINGQFSTASAANGQFKAQSCVLQGHGSLSFSSPINGWWQAAPGDVAAVLGPAPVVPEVGNWVGVAAYGSEDNPQQGDIWFTLKEGGAVLEGQIILRFSFNSMTDEMRAAMREYGCRVAFQAFEADTVDGEFPESTAANGAFATRNCFLEGHGSLNFSNPIEGTWQAAPGDLASVIGEAAAAEVAQAQSAPSASAQAVASSPPDPEDLLPPPDYDAPPHPNDGLTPRELYEFYCEECHGRNGEGDEETPELTDALNAQKIADNIREGPEDMDAFTHEDLPDHLMNLVIDYVLTLHPDSRPRTNFIITR